MFLIIVVVSLNLHYLWNKRIIRSQLSVYRLFCTFTFSFYKTKVDRVDLTFTTTKCIVSWFFSLPFRLFRHFKTQRKLYRFSTHCSYPNVSWLCPCPSMNRSLCIQFWLTTLSANDVLVATLLESIKCTSFQCIRLVFERYTWLGMHTSLQHDFSQMQQLANYGWHRIPNHKNSWTLANKY